MTAGLMAMIFVLPSLLKAETERELLVKRWKVLSHHRSGKTLTVTPHDFLQFKGDGIFEQARNSSYAKGSWALNEDELTINNNGEYKWKVVSVSETTMSLKRGTDETMQLEVVPMPAPVDKSYSSRVQHLCTGKWRLNEHHKGDAAIKLSPSDVMDFYTDGTYEQVLNGVYSKGTWKFNGEETELTIDAATWRVDALSVLFFKITRLPEGKEFIVFAHTR